MLLAVSVLSAAVVGLIGYRSGSESIRQAAFDRLTEVRQSRTAAITDLFDRIQGEAVVLTRGTTAVEAVTSFNNGFAELNARPADPADTQTVDSWYANAFAPKLAEETGEASDPQTFQPTSAAQTYLQARYTVPAGDDYDASLAVDDAGDGSSWSAANATFQDYFRQSINRLGYDDALLLNTDGDVVYSAYKSADLGTNVLTGPLNESNLSTAYRAAMRATSPDFVDITDFEFYAPYYGQPVAWAVSPVARDGVTIGVLALQLPKQLINKVMTNQDRWTQDGLGSTGETYLAGPDLTMRSISRMLVENPSEYVTRAVDAATPRAVAEHAVRINDTILLQPTRTEAVRQGLTGRTGTIVDTEYLGDEALVAYAPITIGDLQWVIVAKLDTSEAFAPVDDFTRNLALSTAAIIFVVCLASLLLAQIFSRPVRRLVTGVNRVATGDLDARVDVNTRDEFGDLATAFNDMGRSLRTKQQLLDEQMAENDRLLHTLMPEQVARRYRDGEQTIAEDHTGVSVIYADVLGYEAFTSGMPSERSLELLNSLVRGFDEAAQRLGIERVRTLRDGYLASCGLQVPRVDNERRTVEFALEMAAVVRRFNLQHGASLNLRAGIDTGPVTSGLIGRTSVMYDMWGDAVSLAFRLQDRHGESGIFVTERVRERLVGMQDFAPAGTVETQDGTQSVWKLQVSTS
ncbi:HAMP domain-containing protein [Nakamurella flava]|uniref:HAMP domain-containing protein n=2 Tax=Nakamurella flava TaxID=2576308 RepID=A0A4U6QPH8_9ACTN|nr:HAMP domain-containing protein [Nakamurella flava]